MIGQLIGGRFELMEVAGAGGMGTVYRARDSSTGGSIALKVLKPVAADVAGLFDREVRVLRTLSHPGIVDFVAHGTTDQGQCWLAMEWLAGQDLEARFERGWDASPEDALLLIRRAADALAVAHGAGVVHRDIKPGNLFLADGELERVKVLDFGIAHTLGTVTAAGEVVGTPEYMAPEQGRGEGRVDARADVYALGCVLYEALTGAAPFARSGAGLAILMKKLIEDPPRVNELLEPERQVAPAVDELVARMLARQADARPADGAVLAREIGEVLGEPAAGGTDIVGAGAPLRALTERERRVVSVVAARGGDAERFDVIRKKVAEHQAGLIERLAGGFWLTLLTGTAGPADLATRAARCALAVAEVAPDLPLVVATGRGELTAALSAGEVIDRVVERLLSAPGPGVTLDAETAQLLPAGFETRREDAHTRLVGMAEQASDVRTLMGRPTPCVGRDEEVELLEQTWRAATGEGRAAAVVILGEPGVGKSRLRHELVRRLAGAPAVLRARGDALSSDSAYGLIRPALTRWLGMPASERINERRKQMRKALGQIMSEEEIEPDLPFLGELAGVPFPARGNKQARAAKRNPELMTERIKLAFSAWLTARCREQPTLLILEDLQWADGASLDLVEAALISVQGPLVVVACSRPELMRRFHGLVWASANVTTMALEELEPEDAAELVRHVLPEASADTVDELVSRSGGNAFYLEELIRAVAAGKGDALPDTVLGMVESRLSELEPDARRVLRAGSVFGTSLWSGGVAALTGGESERADAERWLDELTTRELLRRRDEARFEGEHEYRFRDDLVRTAAYAMLAKSDRTVGHRLAGEWLEARGETDAAALGRHFHLGAVPERASHWYAEAAREAIDYGDLEAGRHLLDEREQALAELQVPPEDRRWGEGWALASKVHNSRGEHEDAETWARRTVDAGRRHGWLDLVARGLVSLGAIARVRGQLQQARDGLVEALQAVATAGDNDIHAECAFELGELHASAGYGEDAFQWYQTAMEVYEQADDVDGVASCYLGIADVARQMGAMDVCQRHAEDARGLFESLGSRRGVAQALSSLGGVARAAGQLDEAVELYNQSLEMARSIGHGAALDSLLALGQTLLAAQRYEEADDAFHAAMADAGAQRRTAELSWAHAGIAACGVALDELDEVEDHLTAALELAAETASVDADGAWMLEQAGMAALEVSLEEHARELLRQAGEQYAALERREDVMRVQQVFMRL